MDKTLYEQKKEIKEIDTLIDFLEKDYELCEVCKDLDNEDEKVFLLYHSKFNKNPSYILYSSLNVETYEKGLEKEDHFEHITVFVDEDVKDLFAPTISSLKSIREDKRKALIRAHKAAIPEIRKQMLANKQKKFS